MTNEAKVMVLTARRNLLEARNPVENMKIIKKLERKIRKYSTKEWYVWKNGYVSISAFINGSKQNVNLIMPLTNH